ncbi:MAG: hypothetical protein HYZ09_04260 [Candidatus Kerfeldbacteria bacterium]|nr:hypothetical protein [Candidatus Kerfeldbacteria bacterium]
MTLSRLQRYILTETHGSPRQRCPRRQFKAFYNQAKVKPKDPDNVITRSLERLIDKELLVGFGRRTPHKWFIDEVRLTAKGRRTARALLGQQQQFAFNTKRAKSL